MESLQQDFEKKMDLTAAAPPPPPPTQHTEEKAEEAEEAEKAEEEQIRAAEAEGYVRAASVAEVKAAPSRKWKCMQVEKRSVTFFHQDDHVFAMDSWCYHNGGGLMRGDIEDFGGRLAVRCPLHSYRIALETGEGLYMGMIGGVKSKGVKQRVHPIKIIGDHIYIKISKPKQTNTPEVQSDCYQFVRG